MIINNILECLKIENPSYLDIGAFNPFFLSNTASLYEKGCRGVCVEPDPVLFEAFKQHRPKDICLNVGIGVTETGPVNFYKMSLAVLNTFSQEEAHKIQSYGNHSITEVVQIPLVNVNTIISTHFAGCPTLVSMDVEGLDYDIIRSFDFNQYRPEIFCIETLTYTEDKSERKLTEVIDWMIANNYFLYADTYINSIFVSKEAWCKRL